MKSALALALFSSLLVCIVHSAATDNETSKKLAAATKKCEEQYKLDYKNVLKVYMDGKEPENEDEKCAMSCWHHEFGTIKDGKFNLDLHGEISKLKFAGDDAKIEKANNIMKGCTEKTQHAGNDCTYASSITKCFMSTSKAEGLHLPE